jgi:hypothetical protein
MFDIAKSIVFLVPIVLIITIAVVIIASFNHRLKKQIIESGRTDDDLLKVLSEKAKNSSEVLKWGLVFFFGGLGLVVLQFIHYDADSATLPFGIEAMFIAVGFLLYYFIMKREDKKPLE